MTGTVHQATALNKPTMAQQIEKERLRLERKFPNVPLVLIAANLSPGVPASLIVSSNLDKPGLSKILQEAQRFSSTIIVPGQTFN